MIKLIQNTKKRTWVIAFGLNAFFIFLAMAYSFLAVLGLVPMTVQIFALLILILHATNGFLVFVFLKNKNELILNLQIVLFLWEAVVLWFWSIAPFFYFLNINIGDLQLPWVAFAYLWLLPVIGGGVFVAGGYLICRNTCKYAAGTYEPKNPEKFYKWTFRIPTVVALYLIATTFLGYFIGTMLLGVFGDMPLVEQIKSFANALISILLAIIVYIFLNSFLADVRKTILTQYTIKNPTPAKLRNKMMVVGISFVAGAFAVVTLVVFSFAQGVIQDRMENNMERDIDTVMLDLEKDATPKERGLLLDNLNMGKRGFVSELEKSKEELGIFSPGTQRIITSRKEGTAIDTRKDVKLVGFFEDPTVDKKIIYTIFLTDFYGPIYRNLVTSAGGIIFVFIVAIGSVTVISSSATRSIKSFVNIIQKMPQNSNSANRKSLEKAVPHTGDEVELLALELQQYIKKSRALIQELDEARKKEEAILASALDGFIVTDGYGKIVYINNAAKSILGYGLDELKDKPLTQTIKLTNPEGEYVPEAKRIITKALKYGTQTSTSVHDGMHYKCKNGNLIPIAITVAPIIYQDTIIGAVETFRDTTEETKVDKMKTEFISLAAHELRTPISMISMNLELLEQKALTHEERKDINEIKKSTNRMNDIVNTLLNVARIELGTLNIKLSKVDLVKLIKKDVKDLKLLIDDKKLDVKLNFDKENITVHTDKNMFQIVLHNILTNAIRYNKKEGVIEISITQDDEHTTVAIQDTGYGIPKKEHDKVFSKMHKIENSSSKKEGIGLGLYMTKSLIENMNGSIWFESKEGEGTTFYVKLPNKGSR